jgi:hypothetical protein
MDSIVTDLLDAYTNSLQEIANQAWAHVPEEGNMVANFKALFDQIDADFDRFKAVLVLTCATRDMVDAVQTYTWKVEREP